MLPGPLWAADPSEPGALSPSSEWFLDAGEDRCRLARQFGDGESKLMLFMEIGQPSTIAEVTIAGHLMDKLYWRKPVTLQFGELEPIVVEKYSKGKLEGYGTGFLSNVDLNAPTPLQNSEGNAVNVVPYGQGGLPAIDTIRFQGNEVLSITQGDRTRAELEMPGFAKALAALNLCTEGFVEYWGLDVEKHKTRQRGPVWTNLLDVAQRIQKAYPRAAIRAGEQGLVRFRVIVDEIGRATDCKQFDATMLDRLESPICEQIIAHAEFEPALDAEGKPMRSYYASRLHYVLFRR